MLTILATAIGLLSLNAQHLSGSFETFEQLIENLAEELEEDADIEAWLEDLYRLHEHPVLLNLASHADLLAIPFINDQQADAILAYRKEAGPFFSTYELASIPAIGRNLAEKLAYFTVPGDLTIQGKPPSARIQQQLIIKGWQSFPKASGYFPRSEKPPAYTGSPLKLYSQYRIKAGKQIEAGLTADKDPGETLFRQPNKAGFDFYSGFIQLPAGKYVPQLIMGDFAVQSGEGLILWQGFGMGKSAEVLRISKGISRIRPYTSGDENRFFRGVAQRLEIGALRIHLFASHKRSDGNLITLSDSTTGFSSLQTSGYHRTLSEIDDKNSVPHSVAGLLISRHSGNWRWGATLFAERFGFPFVRGTQLYQQFMFSGQLNHNAGLHYRWSKGKIQLYGEAAISASGGKAILQGMEGRLNDQFILALIYRHYDTNYQATWASGFGEGNNTSNESGLYIGIKSYPLRGLVLSGYVDWFSSPWINYSTIGPARGQDILLQGELFSGKKLSGLARVKHKIKPAKTKGPQYYYDQETERTQLSVQLRYQPSRKFYLRSRIDRVGLTGTNQEHGIMVAQDFHYSTQSTGLTFNLRGAWFSTHSYASRISLYESDLLYNFSAPAFFGQGVRGYANTRYRLSESFELWLKIATTLYSDRETIGSGYGLIEGNSKTEVKFQIRYRF